MNELTGTIINGRYQIAERIGMGGMAEVYRAQDLVLGRTVAVKVMLPQYAADSSFTQRFKQEAAAAANLQSPYIVNIYDWGQENGIYYIVMEYVRGTDLKSALRERGALHPRKVAEIGAQVCQALAVAHNNDIIHRDIKPQNIMVQPDGNVKVMDFGIARAKNSLKTQTSSVLGTAHYISPEQAQGKPLTAASDIYSLGIVLYEAATGQLPFDGPDAVSVAMKQVNEMPRDPRVYNNEIPANLADIIMHAIEKSPQQRFNTAHEMRSALVDYLQNRANSFAPTQVIGAAAAGAAVGGVAGTAAAGTTTVMPPSTRLTPNSGGTMGPARQTEPEKTGPKKAIIGIVIAVVVALIAAGVAFFVFGGSEKKIEVPDVTGKTVDAATEVIQQAGFTVGTIKQEYNKDVEDGKVIKTDPAARTQAPEKSRINLIVSKGKEKVSVPDVSGMTANEAKAALEKAGLKPTAGTAIYSDSVEKDHVVKTDPAAGTEVEDGASVSYILSLGEEKGSIPYVVGYYYQDAEQMLQNAGFRTSTIWETNSAAEGSVYAQDPYSGSYAKGQVVTIYVSKGSVTPDPSPTTEPDKQKTN